MPSSTKAGSVLQRGNEQVIGAKIVHVVGRLVAQARVEVDPVNPPFNGEGMQEKALTPLLVLFHGIPRPFLLFADSNSGNSLSALPVALHLRSVYTRALSFLRTSHQTRGS
jgi:hypothetical protein